MARLRTGEVMGVTSVENTLLSPPRYAVRLCVPGAMAVEVAVGRNAGLLCGLGVVSGVLSVGGDVLLFLLLL